VREAAHSFGPGSGLIGIFTPASQSTDLCCLFMNAGIIHRIGPHRLNVKMARALSTASVASFRIDLAGRGDSRAATGATSYVQQGVQDTQAAMDFMSSQYGMRRFLIFGICSGAVNAFRSALADPRVVGIFMVDGYWYRTAWTEYVRLWKRFRALSLRSVLRAVRRRLQGRPGTTASKARGEIFNVQESNNPPREQFAREMNQLVGRGVDTFYLFTNSVTDLVSYSGQLAHAFRGEAFVPRMHCEQRLDIDHTMVSLVAQRASVDLLRKWAAAIAVRQNAGR
jgi:hypothetical protein